MATGAAAFLAAVLATALAGPVGAQAPDPSEGAVESMAPAAAPAEIAFPTTLAGVPVEVRSFTGPEWLAESTPDGPDGRAWAEQTQALVESLGRSLDDLSVKTALVRPTEGNEAIIAGVRIAGTEARTYIRELVPLLLGDVQQPELLMRPLPGRWVLRVVDAATPGVYPRTVYLDGETAWIIGADEEYVLELLAQLPAPAGPSPDGADTNILVQQMPTALGGQRRAGLYEAVEPLFLPTFSEHLGPVMEGWLLDLYLDEGISPTDIVGAVAWWGQQATEEGIEVEGYRVPGASAASMDRLLAEVVLGPSEATAAEVSRVEEQVGEHTVTTIERADGSRRHLFSSAGTVWIVTDHAGQPELAAEAVAALP